MKSLFQASFLTLLRRQSYGGRKGRRASRRIAALSRQWQIAFYGGRIEWFQDGTMTVGDVVEKDWASAYPPEVGERVGAGIFGKALWEAAKRARADGRKEP